MDLLILSLPVTVNWGMVYSCDYISYLRGCYDNIKGVKGFVEEESLLKVLVKMEWGSDINGEDITV